MPNLDSLDNVSLRGVLVGAYDAQYLVEGLAQPVSQTELLQYLLNNTGDGGSGINDITEGTTDPSAAPGSGEPSVYQNTSTGSIFVWNGSAWTPVVTGTSAGDDDVTEGSGTPSGAPGAGEPLVYQNTVNGNLYVWDSTQWVLVGGGENDITEGAGTPSGTPGAGEPVIYQDTTNGNVYTWNGSQWNIMAVVASNGLTKTGADVELGGTLEKDTVLDGDSNIRSLGLADLKSFSVSTADGSTETISFLLDPLNGGIYLQRTRADVTQRLRLISPSGGNPQTSLENIDGSTIGYVGSTVPGDVNLSASNSGASAIGFGATVLTPTPEISIVTNDVVGSAATPGMVLTLIDAINGIVEYREPPPSGLAQYPAVPVNDPVDNGVFVTANGTGITYERSGGSAQNTEGILSVPDGVIPLGVSVHFSSAQAPGNTFFLNIDYQNTGRDVNGSQNTVIPAIATVASKPVTFTDAAPATNFVHAGTPLQVGIAQVDDNGTRTRVRYKVTNYAQQVGSNASILTLKLA